MNRFKYLLPLLFLNFALLNTQAQQTNGASNPAPGTDRWQKIWLAPDDRTAVAKALVAYVCTGLASDKSANILALALAIDPSCKDGIVANFQLSQGAFKPVASTTPPADWVKVIEPIVDKLKGAPDQDSKILACHLAYVAALMDPSDETAILTYTGLHSQEIALDWNSFYTDDSYRGQAAPAATTGNSPATDTNSNLKAAAASTPPAIKQEKGETKMKGLVVFDLGMGKMVGKATDIIATRQPNGGVHFSNDKIGDMMKKSLAACYASLKAAHPKWTINDVTVSFDDDHTPVDGPSASTVFSLLLTSLQDGIDLDPKVAITGDMSADLSVQPIGGVRAKITGAMGADCAYVGIPLRNSEDLMDALVLLAPDDSLITKTQIIGLTTYDDALTLARMDRPADYQSALDEFSTLSATFVPFQALTPDQISKLQDILTKIPNHLSAKLLLEREQNGWPKTLSLRSSYTALMEFSQPFFDRFKGNNQKVDLEFTPEFYMDLDKRFNVMRPLFHPEIQPLANHFDNIVRDWRTVAYKMKNESDEVGSIKEMIRDLNKDLNDFKSDITKIQTDESSMAKLLQ